MNKNIIITIALMVCCGIAKAQWSSSGEGKCYTINELSNIDSVNVQKTSEGVFQIGENLTIVQGDTLLLEQSINGARC